MKHLSSGAGPSQRQLQVGEEIRHILSSLLVKDVLFENFPLKGVISVNEVQISPDLKNARAFIMTLGAEHLDEIVETLNQHARQYRHQIAQKISLKFTPKISFKPDLSYLKAQKLEDIFRSNHVKQDLL